MFPVKILKKILFFKKKAANQAFICQRKTRIFPSILKFDFFVNMNDVYLDHDGGEDEEDDDQDKAGQ